MQNMTGEGSKRTWAGTEQRSVKSRATLKFFGCFYEKHETHPDPSKVGDACPTEQKRASELS